jgi:hypothetical protein
MSHPFDAYRHATEPCDEDVTRTLDRARRASAAPTPRRHWGARAAMLLLLGSGATAWAAGLLPGLPPPWPSLLRPLTADRAPTAVARPDTPAAVTAPTAPKAPTALTARDALHGSTIGEAPPAPPPAARPSRGTPSGAPATEPVTFSGTIDTALADGGLVRGAGVGSLTPEGVVLASGRVTVQGARSVRTREAEIMVADGPVVVRRDTLGTTVEGNPASVRCLGEAQILDTTRSCLPVSAEGLLARAAVLRLAGDRAGERATLDLALRTAGTPMLRSEVLYQRATGADVEPEQAIADLEAAWATGATARPDDLDRALARLHAQQGRCATALPHLKSLEARAALGEDVVLLTRCTRAP